MSKTILLVSGDGIGPEIMRETLKMMEVVERQFDLDFEYDEALVGGVAIDAVGNPLPVDSLAKAKAADAILFAAIGGPKWDTNPPELRPEKGLLGLRKELGLFGNLRPAILYPQLAAASSLKADIVSGLDILIVRELTGGIYFGQPRGIRVNAQGEREGFNTYVYSESEIKRIGRMAFEAARARSGRVCSVDKANVLEVTMLWREVMTELAAEYPDVTLSHMLVDNAAMQLVLRPKQFDVIVTGNMFGDILSDTAAMLTGSIGMLPSASLDKNGKGMYEPCHGSAPDIAGQNKANPLAMMLSASMMLRYTFNEIAAAEAIEAAIGKVLDKGYRTGDIFREGDTLVSCEQMGDAVVAALTE
ncbi:MAG TPA: 3-isopropylmalate dehydrogenase [Pseudomonadales bacterium]|nr:3-isopropylmalate dehydrogenase [Pseudomonadales bacterium]